MLITRKWEMPNSKTFKIKSIREIILKYAKEGFTILDPFSNEGSIKEYLPKCNYISNDIDKSFHCNYNYEAQDFLKLFKDNSIDMVLFDPPYSGRQVAECYKKLKKTVTMKDTNSGYFTAFKKEISRILKENGICITCGWNSNGIGEKYGLRKDEILLVAHGAMHNDTIVTIERKIIQGERKC